MIPNLAQQRLGQKTPAVGKMGVVDPAAIAYEEVVVDFYDFNLPCGPSQFMVEPGTDDYFKKDNKEKEYRIRQRTQEGIVIEVTIPFTHVYFFSKHRRTVKRAMASTYQPKSK